MLKRLNSLVVLTVVASLACAGKARPIADGALEGATPASGGTVTVVDANQRTLGTAATGADGSYKLQIGNGRGDLSVCVSGGSHTELSTGTMIQLGSTKLCTVAPAFALNGKARTNITFASHLAFSHAQYLVGRDQISLGEAFAAARSDLNALLGCSNGTDVVDAVPINPSIRYEKPVELHAETQAGLLWGGLSFQAKAIAENQRVTPGVRVNTIVLALALADDLRADGIFNGQGPAGQIYVLDHPLSADSMRGGTLGFVQGLRAFLRSDHNGTRLRFADVRDTVGCMSQASGVLFAKQGIGGLDETGPETRITTPIDGSTVAGIISLACSAHDPSGVKAMHWEASTNGQAIAPAVFKKVNFSNPETLGGLLTGEIDVAALPEGVLDVACVAEDQVANSESTSVKVVIVNRDPVVKVVKPAARATLKKEATIECSCEHAIGAVCNLDEPSSNIVKLAKTAEGNPQATWNTEGEIDGEHVIKCSGVVDGRPPVSDAISVLIDNWPPGSANGAVYADSLVHDVVVRAYAYTLTGKGRLLARVDSGDGKFEMQLPDDYRGPILFEASRTEKVGRSAAYRSTIFENRDVALMDTVLTLLWDQYAPGDHVANLSINIATSLAESLTTGYLVEHPAWLGDRTSIQEVSAVAHQLIGQHLRTQPSIDIRLTPVRDFTAGNRDTAASEDSTLLGLFHVGLSRMGAEIAREEGSSPETLPSVVILERLRRDVSNGVLDGLDHDGRDIPFTAHGRYRLSTDTLRVDLAAAIRRWLNNDDLTRELHGSNRSGLIASHYTHEGGLLRTMTGNGSELFDRQDPAKRFDMEGPVLDAHLTDADGHPWGDRPLRGQVFLTIEAQDDSGVATIAATLAGRALVDEFPPNGEKARFRITTTLFPDGLHDLVIVAKDKVTNPTTVARKVTVDNAEPIIKLRDVPGWIKGASVGSSVSQPIHLIGTTNKPIVSYSISAPGMQLIHQSDLPRDTQNFDVTYTVLCDRRTTISVEVRDLAGNVGHENVAVACDNTEPALAWLDDTNFVPERRYRAFYKEPGRTVRFEKLNQNEETIKLVPTNPPLTISKYMNRLDLLPEQGRDAETANLPVLKFSVNDVASSGPAGVFSPHDELKVEYRYLRDGIEKRGWTSLGSQPAYLLPLSYQTLHSELAWPDPTSLHTIEIRVTDLAGNAPIFVFPFHMDIMVPPVAVYACQPAADLGQYKMGALTWFYNQNTVDMAQASTRWGMDLPAGSQAPQMPLSIKMSSNGMVSHIEALDALSLGDWKEEYDFRPNWCLSAGAGTIDQHWFSGDSDRECHQGHAPGWVRAWNHGSGCWSELSKNWTCNFPDTGHGVVFHVKRSNGQRFDGVNAFDLLPGESADAITAIYAPRLVVHGQIFNGAPFSPDGHFRSFLVDQRPGLEYHVDRTGGLHREKRLVRRFTTYRFMRSVSLDVSPSTATATHPLYGDVPVEYLNTCPGGGSFTHTFD